MIIPEIDLRFKTYKWHSINLLPHLSIVPICEDDYPYNVIASLIEIVILGQVIHVDTSYKIPTIHTNAIGPLWSRKNKKFYNLLPRKLPALCWWMNWPFKNYF